MSKAGKKICLGVAVGIAVLAALILVLFRPETGNKETTGQTTVPPQTETTVSLPAAQLPMELEGGLVLDSLFQYTGLNPDNENQEGTDIAAITLKNTSDTYLSRAQLSVTLTDGNVATFEVTDLPAGAMVMAFSREQTTMDSKAACHGVHCTASFDPEVAAIPETVTITIAGSSVALTNQTDQPLTNLVIYCRNILGTEYFGGVTYQYTIEKIPAHETVTLEAVDCILGLVDVVRVEMSDE